MDDTPENLTTHHLQQLREEILARMDDLEQKREASSVETKDKTVESELIPRITSRVEASSQFLVIAMGFGITNGVIKFGESLQKSFSFTLALLFIAFAIYSARFFFNNWIYLSQSYYKESLNKLNDIQLRRVLRCAHFDMLLSIIAGSSCAFTGTMLDPSGGELIPILILLIFHYISDLVITFHNVWVRQDEKEIDLSGLYFQVVSWIVNNSVFSAIFLMLVILIFTNDFNASGAIRWFPYAWILNSVIAIGITIYFGHQEMRKIFSLPTRTAQQQTAQ
jgi:hypothetical protein